MLTVPSKPGPAGGRVRVAISSPEILAHIRREFATKGLDAQIEGVPMVDVVVTPGARAPAASGALDDALNGLTGPRTRRREPATARYRLALIPNSRPAQDRDSPCGRTSGSPRRPGHRSLSPREAEVMESISLGMSNPDIAAMLHVQQKTVKNHVNRIFTKLGARSRVEAVLIWQRGRTVVE